MAEIEQALIRCLTGRTTPMKTVDIVKHVARPKKEINRHLHDMAKRGLVSKVQESPPTWILACAATGQNHLTKKLDLTDQYDDESENTETGSEKESGSREPVPCQPTGASNAASYEMKPSEMDSSLNKNLNHPSVCMAGQGMSQHHRDAIRKSTVELGKDLIIDDEFLGYFRPDNILTEASCDEIMSKTTRSARASQFMSTIVKRGPKAMPVLIEACVATGATNLAMKLDKDLTKKELNKSENSGKKSPENVHHQATGSSSVDLPRLPEKSGKEDPGNVHCQATDLSNVQPPSRTEQENLHSALTVKPFDETDSGLKKYLTNEEAYKMSSNPRGLAVIINIMFFSKLEFRQGTEYDVEKLKTLFSHLHFEPVVHENPKASEIKEIVLETRQQLKESHDAFILCIMSYGRDGMVLGTDGKAVNIQTDIIDPFDADICPILRNKPKIFITETSLGGDDESDGAEPNMPLVTGMAQLSLQESSKPVDLHRQADMVYAFSTGQGYSATRSKESSSCFIDALDEVFRTFCCEEHILDLLVKVRQKVVERRGQGELSNFPREVTTLFKKLFFFPGYKL